MMVRHAHIQSTYSLLRPLGLQSINRSACALADGTYAPYSTVPEGARAKITTAAYALAGALSELRTAAADAAGIACPEEQEAEEECTPEASTPMLQEAADYMKALNARNVPKVRALVAAIAAGEPLAAVRELYRQARPVYEQVEVLAPAFPAEDEALDARPYSFAEGARSPPRRYALELLVVRRCCNCVGWDCFCADS